VLRLIFLVWLVLSAAPTTQPSSNGDDLPSSLPLPDAGIPLTVNLNDHIDIPGSRGKLTLAVREAERGQATVCVAAPQSELIPTTAARAGDELVFHLEAQDCVLRVEKVVMMTLGDDYVVFTLLDLPTAQRQRVERDLDRIAQSDLTFYFDQRECTGVEMVKYLREQLETVGKDPAASTQPASSFTDVLNGINPIPATMPTTEETTQPTDPPPPLPPTVPLAHCRVRTHEGQVKDLATWLGRR